MKNFHARMAAAYRAVGQDQQAAAAERRALAPPTPQVVAAAAAAAALFRRVGSPAWGDCPAALTRWRPKSFGIRLVRGRPITYITCMRNAHDAPLAGDRKVTQQIGTISTSGRSLAVRRFPDVHDLDCYGQVVDLSTGRPIASLGPHPAGTCDSVFIEEAQRWADKEA